MLNLGSNGGTAVDPRLDKALERIEDTRKEVFATDEWVAEVEERLDTLREAVAALPRVEPAAPVDLRPLLRDIAELKRRPIASPPPAPIIPDIRPIRKEITDLKMQIEDLQVSYNDELTTYWNLIKHLPSDRERISQLEEIERNRKPVSLKPVFVAITLSVVLNVCLVVLSNYI